MTKINLTASDVYRIIRLRPDSKSFLDACRNAGFPSPKENKIDYKIRSYAKSTTSNDLERMNACKELINLNLEIDKMQKKRFPGWDGFMNQAIDPRQSLKDQYPQIEKIWDYEKNHYRPEHHPSGSSPDAFLKCINCGESKLDKVVERKIKTKNCNVCYNHKELRENDKLINHELFEKGLGDEFDRAMNLNKKLMKEKGIKSVNEIYFRGKNHLYDKWYFSCIDTLHDAYKKDWEHKLRRRQGCPQCASKKASPKNNLEYKLKIEGLKDWVDEFKKGNPHINIKEILPGSNKKFNWWCFECNKVWEASPYDRIRQILYCPNCYVKPAGTSFTNILLREELNKYFSTVVMEKKIKVAMGGKKVKYYSLDIFIKNLNLVVQYNSDYYHKKKTNRIKNDKRINQEIKDSGYKMIIIHELYDSKKQIFPNDIFLEKKIDGRIEKDHKEIITKLILGINKIKTDVIPEHILNNCKKNNYKIHDLKKIRRKFYELKKKIKIKKTEKLLS